MWTRVLGSLFLGHCFRFHWFKKAYRGLSDWLKAGERPKEAMRGADKAEREQWLSLSGAAASKMPRIFNCLGDFW